ASGSYLALDAETVRRLLRQLHQTMGDLSQVAQKPVVVVPVDIRRYFRKLIDKEFYDVPVLSYQELSPDIQIQPLGRLLAVA
ncbi:MAG: FHIPEP family type III secretion protein, partial [Kiritimatiellae bacterium]|nr:FHIPEP family type III secretion protein [Kiritimatiellia bacterium]